MLQLDSFFNKIIPHTIIILVSILFLLVSIEANELQKQISGSSGFLNFLYSTNNFVAFLIPILAFTFFISTTKFMLLICDINSKENSIHELISYCFIPILTFMSFYLINLMFFQKTSDIQNFEDVKAITFMFNLTFEDFKTISFFSWILVYVLLIIQLIEKIKISIKKSIFIVLIPSLTVFILKYIFNIIS